MKNGGIFVVHNNRRFQACLTFVALATLCFCRADDAEVLAKYSSNVRSVDFFSTGDPEKVWSLFTAIQWREWFPDAHPELVKRLGQIVARNRAVQIWIEERNKPREGQYQEPNADLFTLGSIPAVWSVRILGAALMDPRPFNPDVGDFDAPATPNIAVVVWALANLGFSDAPTEPYYHDLPTPPPEEVAAWRKWWKENEGRIEQRIWEINPDYFSRTPTATPTAPLPTSTPVVIGEYAATPVASPTPNISKPTSSPTPQESEPAGQGGWIIYVISGLVALGVAGAIVWAIGKR
jgi:hypothetical protein